MQVMLSPHLLVNPSSSLTQCQTRLISRLVFIRFKARRTGHAMNVNTISRGIWGPLSIIDVGADDTRAVSISGNSCMDKKVPVPAPAVTIN
jgi:hydroxymethylglutaryl-CoA reductase